MHNRDKDELDFDELIAKLRDDPRTHEMKKYIQHGTISTYDHCMDVAKMSFMLNRRLHIGANEEDVIAAGFLHDYYLYDWHEHGDHLHGYHHPKIAAENAARDFALSQMAKDAIETHMWPLTLFHAPNSRVAWLVTMADKVCSARETIFERRQKRHEAVSEVLHHRDFRN